uniref:Uncharacterized protein n=1 Tax=Kalanchoe fedtschenkoi TaxID=63787 RepID=A0A7N0ZUC5_KALFE
MIHPYDLAKIPHSQLFPPHCVDWHGFDSSSTSNLPPPPERFFMSIVSSRESVTSKARFLVADLHFFKKRSIFLIRIIRADGFETLTVIRKIYLCSKLTNEKKVCRNLTVCERLYSVKGGCIIFKFRN